MSSATVSYSGGSGLVPAPSPLSQPLAGARDLLPPPAARSPPRLGAPYSLAEDVLSLPCGTLRDLLDCFLTRETRELRLVSVDAKAHVGDHMWNDRLSLVCDTRRWRACFPRAYGVALNHIGQVWCEADFLHLRGITHLDVDYCTLAEGASAAACLALLNGRLYALYARECEVDEDALKELKGIKVVELIECEEITEAGLSYLAGVEDLSLEGCAVTDKGLQPLAGARKLDISRCQRVTGSSFQALIGLQELRMAHCRNVTPASLAHLATSLQVLDARGCTQLTDVAFEPLAGRLKDLDISGCTQLSDTAFVHFRGLKKLKMESCTQRAITDAAFAHLEGIEELDMSACKQRTITDAALSRLTGIRKLSIRGCTQLTDAALAHAARLRELNISGCSQLTNAAIASLSGLKKLNMRHCPQLSGAALALMAPTLQELEATGCRELQLYRVAHFPPAAQASSRAVRDQERE